MKGIWISAIVVAFTVGTIVTGASVFASDFIFPEPYIRSVTENVSPGNDVEIFLACLEGDTFVSGSAGGEDRGGGTPLSIPLSQPEILDAGPPTSLQWHAIARWVDATGDEDFTVNIICLDTNNGDDTHDTSESESESESDESETNDIL